MTSKWQELTDKEIMKVYDDSLIVHSDTHYEFNNFKFARAIEHASKEKNSTISAFCKHGLPRGMCRLGEKDCD